MNRLRQYIIEVDSEHISDYKAIEFQYYFGRSFNKKTNTVSTTIIIKVFYYDELMKQIYSDSFKFIDGNMSKHKNKEIDSEKMNELFNNARVDICNQIIENHKISIVKLYAKINNKEKEITYINNYINND